MKISNERKLELRNKFKEAQQTLMSEDWIASAGDDYDEICIDVPEWDKIFNLFMDILDQELSNHTQRVREELEAWSPTHYKGYGVSPLHMTLDDHKRNFVKELLQLPSLNPTKDNEKEA